MFLPVFICMSVCLLARLLKKRVHGFGWNVAVDRCRDIWTNWLTFEPDPDYSPDAGTGLLSPISYKRCYEEFYVGKIPRIRIWRSAAAARRGFSAICMTWPDWGFGGYIGQGILIAEFPNTTWSLYVTYRENRGQAQWRGGKQRHKA